MFSVNSFPILFCGLPFATRIASSTLAACHSLFAPLPPGLGWKGNLPPRDQIVQDHLFSALNGMKHFCTTFWELRDILCYCRVLGQRQYAWSSSALFLQHRNNCEFLARGSRCFTVFWVEFNGLRLVHRINVPYTLPDWTSVAGQGARRSFPACVFLHQIFLVSHVNCIHFTPWPLWLCHYMLMLCFCAHLEVSDLVSNFCTCSPCVSGLWKELTI